MTEYDDGCPYCWRHRYDDEHLRFCKPTSVQQADGCPMCGEEYDSYLDHLAECKPKK